MLPDLATWNAEGAKVAKLVRAGMSVETNSPKPSKLRPEAASSDHAAPTGLKIYWGLGTTNMALLTELPTNPFNISKNRPRETWQAKPPRTPEPDLDRINKINGIIPDHFVRSVETLCQRTTGGHKGPPCEDFSRGRKTFLVRHYPRF